MIYRDKNIPAGTPNPFSAESGIKKETTRWKTVAALVGIACILLFVFLIIRTVAQRTTAPRFTAVPPAELKKLYAQPGRVKAVFIGAAPTIPTTLPVFVNSAVNKDEVLQAVAKQFELSLTTNPRLWQHTTNGSQMYDSASNPGVELLFPRQEDVQQPSLLSGTAKTKGKPTPSPSLVALPEGMNEEQTIQTAWEFFSGLPIQAQLNKKDVKVTYFLKNGNELKEISGPENATLATVSFVPKIQDYNVNVDSSTLVVFEAQVDSSYRVSKAIFTPDFAIPVQKGVIDPRTISEAIEMINLGQGILLQARGSYEQLFSTEDVQSVRLYSANIEYRLSSSTQYYYPFFLMEGTGVTKQGYEVSVKYAVPAYRPASAQ